MSRISLHRPRLSRAVSRRPATGTRLLPGSPFPYPVLHPNTHNKRCPKAQRLSLGSDQSPPRPQYCLVPVTGSGRFLNSNRLALLRGQHRRISAPVPGRIYVAGIDLAGESEQPGDVRLQGFKPTQDSTVVTIGELQMLDVGSSRLPALTVVEHHWWTGKPHTETFSGLVHLLKNVWGCRRVVVDAIGIGADVAAFLPKTIGPSIVVPLTFTAPTICTPTPIGNPSRGVERPASVRTTGGSPTPGEGSLTLKPLEEPAPSPSRGSSGVAHPRLSNLASHPRPPYAVLPSPLPSIELEAEVGALAPTSASVLLSPSPLMALRERGTKGVSVPFLLLRLRRPSLSSPTPVKNPSFPPPVLKLEGAVGAGAPTAPSVFPSPSPLKALRERGIKGERVPSPPPATREVPRNPFRRRSIKPATSSINLQSKNHN